MAFLKSTVRLALLAQLLSFLPAAAGSKCKAAPGSPDWPSTADWTALNTTLSGALLQPPPPGAVCHPDQPTYDNTTCLSLQQKWLLSSYHVEQPISNLWNNFNNDTCLPDPSLPCSPEGYPVYVINATSAEDVKAGIQFAGAHNLRVIIKGTGHDYLGRSSAPNSLSIWTHHLKGLVFHDSFAPKGCDFSIDTPAITAASGSQFGEIDEQASAQNLTVVSGGAASVGIGGFLTGGGHSVLSPHWGLAVDNIYEMEIVTPGGEILTINECQNQDLFWAMRGGGGSTFGVLTSATMRAWPSPKFATVSAIIVATQINNPHYWDVVASVLAGFPELSDQGIGGYGHIGPNYTGPQSPTTAIDVFDGAFNMPLLSPTNTSESLAAAFTKLYNEAIAPYPGEFLSIINAVNYTDFWAWYKDFNGPLDAGYDLLLGSRLLTPEHLQKKDAIKEAFKAFIPPVSGTVATLHLVSGKGVWEATPRGGGNSVNPAWRRCLIHTTTSVTFPPLDPIAKAEAEHQITNEHDAAMRKLAPDTGAYVNEADPNEPDFQHAFWGTNYDRLLSIKREVDPTDVLWCSPCVGNERWEVVDDMLCQK